MLERDLCFTKAGKMELKRRKQLFESGKPVFNASKQVLESWKEMLQCYFSGCKAGKKAVQFDHEALESGLPGLKPNRASSKILKTSA